MAIASSVLVLTASSSVVYVYVGLGVGKDVCLRLFRPNRSSVLGSFRASCLCGNFNSITSDRTVDELIFHPTMKMAC